MKKGMKIFGAIHKAAQYLTTRPTDQCTKCQGFGHKWAECKATTDSCVICAQGHSTHKHFCLDCNTTDICAHTSAKCKNCEGPHKATD